MDDLMNSHLTNSQVTIYTSESQVRSPGKLLRSMWRDLRASRELSWRLFVRDLSAQYRQSFFGILWAFVPPIVTSLIFIFLQSRNIVNFGETDIPYPVYVLVSVVLWQIFSESLNGPLKSVTAAKPMLAKINFPREALIISAFYMALFNILIKMVIILVVLLAFKIPLTWGLLLAPVAILMLCLLGFGMGLVLTPVGMLYTDIGTSIPIFTQLFFFVTPVVYPVPEEFPFSLIAVLNPVSPLLIAARDLITVGTISNPVAFTAMSILTLTLVLFAWVIYHLSLSIIIERMSA
jgi:lipopolysaccharide transport system permease protein